MHSTFRLLSDKIRTNIQTLAEAKGLFPGKRGMAMSISVRDKSLLCYISSFHFSSLNRRCCFVATWPFLFVRWGLHPSVRPSMDSRRRILPKESKHERVFSPDNATNEGLLNPLPSPDPSRSPPRSQRCSGCSEAEPSRGGGVNAHIKMVRVVR